MPSLLTHFASSALPTKPARWNGEWVRLRLREAFEVELRLPGASFKRNNGSAWPVAVVHEFSEMVSWHDTRERVWDEWARARGAYPYEVSRMEEALGWLALLREHEGERRCLAAWALLTARRKSIRLFLARRKWSRTTFYRKAEDGSKRIAQELQRRGVHIR